MVDYNIAIPQQQLFQAPDVMQNAMRMQQMQAQGAQMQELARQRSEEEALRGIRADPNSPEYIQQVARISPRLGMQALTQQRQAAMFNRQGELASRQAEKTDLDISAGRLDLVRKFNADLPGVLTSADPAKAYASWRARIKQVSGQEPGVPEVYPGEAALRGIMDTTEAFLTRTTPQPREIGKTLGRYNPATNTFEEAGVVPYAGGPVERGAGTGPATAAMSPDRLAAMRATQERLGLPVMQPDAGAAGVAVNNMPGAAVAPAAVGNAMRPAASPYGALPVGAGAFAQQQESATSARDLDKQRAIEIMKAQVASEAPPRAMTADQERRMLNTVSKDRLSAETTISTMDDVLKAVKDVQDLAPKQKESVTGLTAKLPPVFADSRTARTKLDNLKGVVTQMGKRVASLGGAIGNMAVQEWKIVSDAIASLDTTNMNPKDLNDQLDIIAAKASAAAARTKDAYERQYEELKTKHGTRFDLSGGAATKTSTELSVDDLLKKYAK